MKAAALQLGGALKAVLKRSQVDDDKSLERDLVLALDTFRATVGALAIAQQQREAVRRVKKTVHAVQVAARRADAAFAQTPLDPWIEAEWTAWIPIAWCDLEPSLRELHERLDAWLAKVARPPRRKGLSHKHISEPTRH
jgi:hypothetical protein